MTTPEGLKKKIKEAGQKGKKKVLEEAAKLEATFEQKGLRGGVEHLVSGAADATVDAVGKAVEAGQDLHGRVQAGGGYATAARHGVERAGKALDAVVERFEQRLQARYQQFDAAFKTGGQYDPAKVRQMLKDKAAATAQYGRKAVDTLATLAGRKARNLKADYDAVKNQFPRPEELSTRYTGIGAKYAGVLFRDHYEQCLAFHARAKSALPGGLKARDAVLADILASASGSAADLTKWYADHPRENPPSATEAMTKAQAVGRYLVSAPPQA